jgi:hypothetical protein
VATSGATDGVARPLLTPLRDRIRRTAPLLVVVVGVALVAAAQLMEDLADSEPLQLLSPTTAIRRWTVIVAVLYMLAIARSVDGLVVRSMAALRDDVQLDEGAFERYTRRLRRLDSRTEVLLLAGAAAVVIGLFPVLGSSLPIDDPVTNEPRHVPGLSAEGIVILAGYTVLGWAVLSLVACTVRRARALGQLSREPFRVDVFDTSNLLPFGNMALAASLAPAGIIVILLFGFGRPSAPVSWSVLLLATGASILALLLPLRGIHRQMSMAKHAAVGGLNSRIRELHERVESSPGAPEPASRGEAARQEIAWINDRVSTLVNLRRTVQEMTTWPFRDTLAFGRAVLIASAPLIYTVMSELIKVFWISPLAK